MLLYSCIFLVLNSNHTLSRSKRSDFISFILRSIYPYMLNICVSSEDIFFLYFLTSVPFSPSLSLSLSNFFLLCLRLSICLYISLYHPFIESMRRRSSLISLQIAWYVALHFVLFRFGFHLPSFDFASFILSSLFYLSLSFRLVWFDSTFDSPQSLVLKYFFFSHLCTIRIGFFFMFFCWVLSLWLRFRLRYHFISFLFCCFVCSIGMILVLYILYGDTE